MTHDLWVFGYGSLMWHPGFPAVEAVRAELKGFHRALCIYSTRYRGTSAHPGLVFGLDLGGFCEGIAFRVAAEHAAETIRYLRDREQVTGVYRAEMRMVQLHGLAARTLRALTFVANRQHRQYAGVLPMSRQVQIVRASHGVSGPNAGYVRSTADHMREIGIRDQSIELLAVLLGRSSHSQSKAQTYARRLVRQLPTAPALRSGYFRNIGL